MGGYIGSSVGNVANAAERKQTYSITTATTSLTGLAYTPTKVHVFHNGVRLVDGTDYTATNGTSITLTNAAQNGDEVVVISYPSFQTSDTVSAANGGTFAGNVTMSSNLNVDTIKDTGGTTAVTIDSSGRVLQPAKPCFTATLTSGDISATNDLVFNNEVFDIGGNYSTSTGKFTAPITGIYWLAWNITFNAQSGNKHIEIYVNSSDISIQALSGMPSGDNEYQSTAISFAYQLTANDTIYAKVIGGAVEGASGRCSFSGYLLA